MGVCNQDTTTISAASEARTETDLSTENWHQAWVIPANPTNIGHPQFCQETDPAV